MRYATSLAKAALALLLPFILAHCASLLPERLPLTYECEVGRRAQQRRSPATMAPTGERPLAGRADHA
jgi:hypothetical protein